MIARRQFLAISMAAAASGAAPQQVVDRIVRIVRSARPEDLEMPLAGFRDFITPIEHFFVRSHTAVPKVDAASWRLQIVGNVASPLTFTIDEIRKMPSVEVIGVLECSGNGRSFYEPTVAGLQWTHGAVGNGRWRGVRLADLLKRAGLRPGTVEILFDGDDVPIGTMPDFQRSIPLRKALHPDTLLAHTMNGETLPAKHGFPLRAIVPGWAGSSWVKWLTSINVLNEESRGFWMKNAYLHPGKPVPPGMLVPAEAMRPVTSLAIKSVIAFPENRQKINVGKPVVVRGTSWSGDRGSVAAVDISVDEGRSWKPARLSGQATPYGWRLWEYAFTPLAERHYTILARARDTSGDVQPIVPGWNPSGYLWNAIARVDVAAGNLTFPDPPAIPPSVAPQPANFRAACLTCHEDDVIRQQRLTRAQWDREINKMTGWGARVSPEDREAFLDYLLQLAR